MSLFSERLSRGRVEKGWTQEQAAAELGVPKSTWGGWERDDARPRPEKLRLIADLLDVPLDELTTLFVLSAEQPRTPVTLERRVEDLEREVAVLKTDHRQVSAALRKVIEHLDGHVHRPNQAPTPAGP